MSQREGGCIGPANSQTIARSVFMVRTTPRPLYALEKLGTLCAGGWLGLGASLNVRGKSRPH
jgi:hypothetical protein